MSVFRTIFDIFSVK